MGLYGNTFLNESNDTENNYLSIAQEMNIIESTFREDMMFESALYELDILTEADDQPKKSLGKRILEKFRELLGNLITFLKSIKDKIKELFGKFFNKSKEADKTMEQVVKSAEEKKQKADIGGIEIEYYDYFELLDKTSITFRTYSSYLKQDTNFNNLIDSNEIRDLVKKTFVTSYKDYINKMKDNDMSISDMKDYIMSYHTTTDKKNITVRNFNFSQNYQKIKKFETDLNKNYKEMNAAIDQNIKEAENYKKDLEQKINNFKFTEDDIKDTQEHKGRYGYEYKISDDGKDVSWNLKDKYSSNLSYDDKLQQNLKDKYNKEYEEPKQKYSTTGDIPAYVRMCTNLANINSVILKEMCYICMKAKAENAKIAKRIASL